MRKQDDIFLAAVLAMETVSFSQLTDEEGNLDESQFERPEEGRLDSYGLERLFHTFPQEQLELMVCLYFGFDQDETVEALQYKNKDKYRAERKKLITMFSARKEAYLGV